jgi:hypothetical protein
MGGLHSGRKRRAISMNECLEIDTAWLKKRKLLQDMQLFEIVWTRWTETDFKKREKQEYKTAACVVMSDEKSVLTLSYSVARQDNRSEHTQHMTTLSLESTACNYGGLRWWFRAPCCGRRVRVLYINLKTDIANMTPQCRGCQRVHYPSQLASYQERHASYERHLLRNFGYWWAEDQYRAMKEHYFQVTPEYACKAERSQLEQHLQMIRLLISCERLVLKSRIDTLKQFSVEGRKDFFASLATDPEQAEDLAEYQHLANILIAKGVIPADNPAAKLPSDAQEVTSLRLIKWMDAKEETELALKELDALAA